MGLRVRGLVMTFVASVALSSTGASANPNDPAFCIVPVKDGAPTDADVGATWRITAKAFHIPGLAGPVFIPVNRGGKWTIDNDRRLIRHDGPFPRNSHDMWAMEPWSGRIVGVSSVGVTTDGLCP